MVSITKFWRVKNNANKQLSVLLIRVALLHQGFIVLFLFFFLLWKPAITAVEVAILLRTVRNPRGSESSAATTVANLATWLVTVIMPMSRSAILVANLDTFRRTAPK